jgi:uncharacterized membrane protein
LPRVPALLIVALHVLPPAAFAFIHGQRLYGTRGILAFAAFCLGSGAFFESLSLRTGFPFGHYFFAGVMGPEFFDLPILLALAYVGLGYLSWVLAVLILGAAPGSRSGILVLPMIAAILMTAWDLAMDPVWCNIDHAWVWQRGGAYFGVPVTNFAGRFLTTWLGYQMFALWRRHRDTAPATLAWNRLPVMMYGAAALGSLLLAVPSALPPARETGPGLRFKCPLTDPTNSMVTGRSWPTARLFPQGVNRLVPAIPPSIQGADGAGKERGCSHERSGARFAGRLVTCRLLDYDSTTDRFWNSAQDAGRFSQSDRV